MRYESLCRYRATFFKIALTPSPTGPYIILLISPNFPANNSHIIAMHFLSSHFNAIIPDTFWPKNMHGLSHEKTSSRKQDFLLKLTPLITSWSKYHSNLCYSSGDFEL